MPLSCFVLQTSSIRATFCRSPWVIVTNVVNPHDISPEIACFGLGLTTFVTSGVRGAIVRTGAAGFALPSLTDLAALAAVSKRELSNIACNSPVSPSSCGSRSLRLQHFREYVGAGSRGIACDFGCGWPHRRISGGGACCTKPMTPLLPRSHCEVKPPSPLRVTIS